jgi:hypothetical protein
MNNKIIFNICLVNLSKQTSKVTATFEITKNGKFRQRQVNKCIESKSGKGTQEVSSSGNE